MVKKMAYEGKTYFNIDSNLLFQLGEKLVTNRAVALAELVKNSTIVRDIVRSYGGEVQFIDAPNDWKTCIEVTLPKRW